ncbi:MAG TPA: AI-2E family transporter, partial [Chloroflexota bacterium]|nr:AI-2E family transporter [Chloroflexota bacterium]
AARQPLSGRARRWLVLGSAAAAAAFLVAVHTVLQPFIWAAVVSYILHPVVTLLQRRLRLTRGWSVAAVMLVLLGLAAWGIGAAIPRLRSDYSALSGSLAGIDAYLTNYLPNAGTLSILGVPVQVTTLIRDAQATIVALPHLILRSSLSVASHAVATVLQLLTFLISTFYLLLDAPRLGAWLTNRLPAHSRGETMALARDVNVVLGEYLRAEVILIGLMSTVSLIALSLLGVHFALVLAPVVGFLEIFPIIGPLVAITMVALVALLGPAGFGLSHVSYAVIVALVFFVLRQIEDYLVIPNVVGHAVRLQPVVILFALLAGAALGGILGMFLAVPVTGALKVLGSYAYDRLVE